MEGGARTPEDLETLLEDASFDASERGLSVVRFEAEDVRAKLQALVQDQQLSRFIL